MYLYQFCKPTYIGDILKCVRWLYLYDDGGSIIGLQSGGETYYLSKTLEGDVTAVLDESGTKVAQYVYDMWGKLVGVYDGAGRAVTDPEHIALRNPFRYRGYMYDEESGLYYLQSRYYDPVTGRFVNADDALRTSMTIGSNLLAYCGNNPINYSDPNGRWFIIDDIFTGPIDELAVFAVVAIVTGIVESTKDQRWTDGTGALQIDPELPTVERERPAIILPPPNVDQEPEKAREPLPWSNEDPPRKKPSAIYYDAILLKPGIMVNYAYAMDADQASAHLLSGNHVWTKTEADAKALARYVSGDYVSGNNEWLVKTGQNAFHYHLKDRQAGAHIFYGNQAVELIWPF